VIHSAYIFAKVLFTAVILPNIFHNLTRISVFCAESCQPAVHLAGSVRGLWKI
jgi:hypothetical protein